MDHTLSPVWQQLVLACTFTTLWERNKKLKKSPKRTRRNRNKRKGRRLPKRLSKRELRNSETKNRKRMS
jgi:hypothetical protein